MSRDVDPAIDPELEADPYRLLVMAELDFPSAPVYVHSGVGEVDFDGKTFLGVGQLGKVSPLQETTELQSYGLSLELSGVDPALVSISLNDNVQGRDAKIYLVFLDEDLQIINPPVGPWVGRMDYMGAEVGQTATLILHIESRLADWERARIRRYTDEDQQAEYPGDKGLEFVSQMQEKELLWGPKP